MLLGVNIEPSKLDVFAIYTLAALGFFSNHSSNSFFLQEMIQNVLCMLLMRMEMKLLLIVN